MPMPPCPQFLLMDAGHFSPPSAIAIPVPSSAAVVQQQQQQHVWPFHSFSAPCSAASHLEEYFVQHEALLSLHQCQPHANGSSNFVRSQSESAALNKLAQMNISRVPQSLAEDHQRGRLPHFLTSLDEGPHANGKGSTGSNNGGGKVKFYAPLQSDSEGEDSLVSSPDEEEEEEEEEEHDQQDASTLAGSVAGEDTFDEDFGLGTMDEDVEEREAAGPAGEQQQHFVAFSGHGSPPRRPHTPPSFGCHSPLSSPAASSDYVTVPRLLASLDIAQPAQPSPMVQLPLQVPLIDVDLLLPSAAVESILVNEEKEEGAPEGQYGGEEVCTTRCPKKPRRSVRFADDCGQCLETVRVMTEPSDYPPKISPAVLRRFRRAAALAMQKEGQTAPASNEEEDSDEVDDEGESKRPRATWKLGFKQPASEYIKFRNTLDTQKVALENVMLKNELGRMVGTIKVANIAFHKEVFVRYSADGWRTFVDKPAQYQSSPSKTFDTFRFDVEIPRNESQNSRLEFCICFKAVDIGEFWDSNGGRNYTLTSPEPAEGQFFGVPPQQAKQQHPPLGRSQPIGAGRSASLMSRDDPYRMDWNSPTGWSSTNFASWRQLPSDSPYWSCTPPLNNDVMIMMRPTG